MGPILMKWIFRSYSSCCGSLSLCSGGWLLLLVFLLLKLLCPLALEVETSCCGAYFSCWEIWVSLLCRFRLPAMEAESSCCVGWVSCCEGWVLLLWRLSYPAVDPYSSCCVVWGLELRTRSPLAVALNPPAGKTESFCNGWLLLL